MTRPIRILLFALFLFAAVQPLGARAPGTTTVILVRHAEKQLLRIPDPELTDAGRGRADRLAALLARAGVTAILTSQWARTKQTAEPLARATGVRAEEIALQLDPEVPPKPPLMTAASRARVLEWIRAHRGQTVVVIGHSNTVPDIISALGGPEVVIDETVYDDLFVVTLAGSTARCVRLVFP